MPQPPSQLPPILRDQRKTDLDHLRLLAVFHFVVAGLSLVGLAFLFLHFRFMHLVFENQEMMNNQGGGPAPAQFLAIFKWFYLVAGLAISAGGLGNLLSGLFILNRKNRLFSLFVSGFNCLQFPFGTVLGIFTFIVLLRDSVRELYEAEKTARSPY